MRSTLLATAVAAVLATAGTAHAAMPQKSAAAAQQQATAQQLAEMKAQIAALQAQLDELQTRTDAQSDINVANAKTTDDAAKAQDKLDKLSKLVNDTSVTGTIFADVTSQSIKDNGVKKSAANGMGMDVKRAYIGINHKFNDIYSANITTDFQYSSAVGATELYIKKAYLQGKYSDAFTVRLGAAELPWVPFAEGQYGYRYVENSVADRLKLGTSSDWGLHVFGALHDNLFNYAVSAVNGGGYKNPTRSKGMDLEARVGVAPIEGLNIAVGGYHGKLGKEVQGTSAEHSANRMDALVAYGNKWFRVGGEYFQANNWNRVLLATAAPPASVGGYGLPVYNPTVPANLKSYVGDRAQGWSVYGNVNPNEKVSVFARYDQADVSRWLDPSLKDTYFNVGVDYLLAKGIKIAAVYKHEDLKDNFKTNAKADEFGVWTEVKF